jgi:hypothetical protein
LPKMVEALRSDPLLFYRENKLEPPSGLEEELERRRQSPRRQTEA